MDEQTSSSNEGIVLPVQQETFGPSISPVMEGEPPRPRTGVVTREFAGGKGEGRDEEKQDSQLLCRTGEAPACSKRALFPYH